MALDVRGGSELVVVWTVIRTNGPRAGGKTIPEESQSGGG